MKVLLINTSQTDPDRYPLLYYPTGLLYVASSLISKGYNVEFIDALSEGMNDKSYSRGMYKVGMSNEEIISQIKKIDPEIIGLSVMFSINWNNIVSLCKLIKLKFPEKVLVLGGTHVCADTNNALKESGADYIIRGEGEYALPELLDQLNNHNKPDSIVQAELISNLNELSFPARELLDIDKYFYFGKTHNIHGISGLDRWATIITSRGCPYNCTFCSIHNSMGKKYRARSAENVLAEIDYLVKEYNITDLVFEDDNLIFNKDRFHTICEKLIQRNYNLRWYIPNGIRSENLDQDLLSLMKKSGCQKIWIAPESGDQYIIDHIIGKKLNLKKIESVVEIAKIVDLDVACFFVVGFPGEKKENLKNTYQFMKKLYKKGLSKHWIAYATPFLGTNLYEICFKKNLLKRTFNPFIATPRKPSIITPGLSQLILKWYYSLIKTYEKNKIKRFSMLIFHLSPQKIQDYILKFKYMFGNDKTFDTKDE